VRGIEARTLLDSFNTGHAGSLATIHANSAAKALRRFANLVLRSHSQATFEDVESEIGEAVDLVIHVEREPGRRVIREVLRLQGYDRSTQRFQTEYIYPAGCEKNGVTESKQFTLFDSANRVRKEEPHAWDPTQWIE